MEVRRDIEAFGRLVETLRLWLHQLVFVGGWAHRLHRLYPLAQPLEYPPLMTRDMDVAVPAGTTPTEDKIGERLVAAGFQEEFLGENQPPVTRYQLGSEYSGLYAEFLTPFGGGGYRRDGSPDVTTHNRGRECGTRLRRSPAR